MRILAIDLGTRRVGLAISDPEERFALPLEIVARTNDPDLLDRLCSIAAREEAELLLVGEPRRLDGSTGAGVSRARDFATQLAAPVGSGGRDDRRSAEFRRSRPAALPLDRDDQRRARVGRARRSPRPRRTPLDALAAQVFLEDFLARRGRPAMISKLLRISAVVIPRGAAVALAGGGWLERQLAPPFQGFAAESVTFEVPRGSSGRSILAELERLRARP